MGWILLLATILCTFVEIFQKFPAFWKLIKWPIKIWKQIIDLASHFPPLPNLQFLSLSRSADWQHLPQSNSIQQNHSGHKFPNSRLILFRYNRRKRRSIDMEAWNSTKKKSSPQKKSLLGERERESILQLSFFWAFLGRFACFPSSPLRDPF